MEYIIYTEIAPQDWASQFIDKYWVYENNGSDDINVNVLPDGCSDIIIASNNNTSKVNAIGCMTKSSKAIIKPDNAMFGIRFKPACARAFLELPLNVITDKTISFDDITNFDINSIPGIWDNNLSLFTSKIEKQLKKIFNEKHYNSLISSIADYIIQNNGAKRIDDISSLTGMSKRNLERKFTRYIGISPKLFSRIVRFMYSNKVLKSNSKEALIDVALDAGYYDQAHFCKEYKEFSGFSPLNN